MVAWLKHLLFLQRDGFQFPGLYMVAPSCP